MLYGRALRPVDFIGQMGVQFRAKPRIRQNFAKDAWTVSDLRGKRIEFHAIGATQHLGWTRLSTLAGSSRDLKVASWEQSQSLSLGVETKPGRPSLQAFFLSREKFHERLRTSWLPVLSWERQHQRRLSHQSMAYITGIASLVALLASVVAQSTSDAIFILNPTDCVAEPVTMSYCTSFMDKLDNCFYTSQAAVIASCFCPQSVLNYLAG